MGRNIDDKGTAIKREYLFLFNFQELKPLQKILIKNLQQLLGLLPSKLLPLVRCQTKKLFICAMNTIFTSHSASPCQHFLILALSVCVQETADFMTFHSKNFSMCRLRKRTYTDITITPWHHISSVLKYLWYLLQLTLFFHFSNPRSI